MTSSRSTHSSEGGPKHTMWPSFSVSLFAAKIDFCQTKPFYPPASRLASQRPIRQQYAIGVPHKPPRRLRPWTPRRLAYRRFVAENNNSRLIRSNVLPSRCRGNHNVPKSLSSFSIGLFGTRQKDHNSPVKAAYQVPLRIAASYSVPRPLVAYVRSSKWLRYGRARGAAVVCRPFALPTRSG